MNEQDPLLDSALDSYPMVPLPAGFIQSTMRSIRPLPHFQLQFLDYALPSLIATLMLVGIGLFLWLNGTLTFATLPTPELAFSFSTSFRQLPTTLLLGLGIALEIVLMVIILVWLTLWNDSTVVRQSIVG